MRDPLFIIEAAVRRAGPQAEPEDPEQLPQQKQQIARWHHERCYKKAYPHEKAMQMILNGECGAFNPLLLECLVDIQGELQEALRKNRH